MRRRARGQPRDGVCKFGCRHWPGQHVAGMLTRLVSASLSVAVLATALPAEDRTPAAPVAARPSTAFRFEALDVHGRAVRWDPCADIMLRFNPAHAPAGSRRELQEAVRVVRRATGLRIRLVGDTTTQPSATYADTEASGQWPDVLVAFVRPSARLLSDQSVSAETTTAWVTEPGGRARYVTGEVLVNAAQNGLYGDGADHGASRVRLFEHELGHLVGLAHVKDRRSVMYPRILRRRGLTAGDRRGLRELGPAGDLAERCPQ